MHQARGGFTLVELLIVVVVIGLLASIALPKFSTVRERALIAAVTSDLKVFASQQASYQGTYQVYATDVSQLTDLTLTHGVTITINEVNGGMGWSATGIHVALPSRMCGIYYGNASAAMATPASQVGRIACQP